MLQKLTKAIFLTSLLFSLIQAHQGPRRKIPSNQYVYSQQRAFFSEIGYKWPYLFTLAVYFAAGFFGRKRIKPIMRRWRNLSFVKQAPKIISEKFGSSKKAHLIGNFIYRNIMVFLVPGFATICSYKWATAHTKKVCHNKLRSKGVPHKEYFQFGFISRCERSCIEFEN